MITKAIQVIEGTPLHRRYLPGEILEVGNDLAQEYVEDGFAVIVSNEIPEEKALKRSGKRRGDG
jgi:hypothetical protein